MFLKNKYLTQYCKENNKNSINIALDIFYAYKIFGFNGIANDIRAFVDIYLPKIIIELNNNSDIKYNFFLHPSINPRNKIYCIIKNKIYFLPIKIINFFKYLHKKFNIGHYIILINNVISIFAQNIKNKNKNNNNQINLIDNQQILLTKYYIKNTITPLISNINNIDIIISFVIHDYIYKNKIEYIRIHDLIWLTHPEMASPNADIVNFHKALKVKTIMENVFFLCNSLPTMEKLITFFPECKDRCYIIPCHILPKQKIEYNFNSIKNIINSYLSNISINSYYYKYFIFAKNKLNLINELELLNKNKQKIKYILMVSTIEPRKNHLNAIKAWEKLKLEKKYSNIKLIIVGNPGWKYQNIFQYMEKYVKSNEILHLTNIKSFALDILYSNALLFISPSFAEGYGIPPVEALQCKCSILVSDISEHKWVLQNQASYCDPFNVNDIYTKMKEMI